MRVENFKAHIYLPITQGCGYYTIYLSQFFCFVFLGRLIVGFPRVIFHECFQLLRPISEYNFFVSRITVTSVSFTVHGVLNLFYNHESGQIDTSPLTGNPLNQKQINYIPHSKKLTIYVMYHGEYINLELSRRVFLSVFVGNSN